MSLRAELEKRLAEAQAAGKVLNVSKLREDGVGAVKANRPATQGRDAKGKNKYIEGLDIISDDYTPYEVAAKALGKPEFAKRYREFYGTGKASPKPSKSPKVERGAAKTFGERLQEAVLKAQEEDKLVDVSNLTELKNGQLGGFRTVARYSKAGKDTYRDNYSGKKMWIEGLPIISNNFDSYARAVNALDRADLAREFGRKHGEDFDFRTEKGAGGAGSPGRKSPSKKSPAVKLNAAEQLYEMYSKAVNTGGKLDVSGLDADKGTGSRVIHPKTDREITKVGVPRLEVVSNSFAKFAEAMALLDQVYSANGQEGNFSENANEYFRLHGDGPPKRGAGGSPKAKVPKRVRAKSVSRVGSGSNGSGSQGGSGGRARSLSRSGSQGSLAVRLARAASEERRTRAASQERARSASQGRARSGSQGRSGSRSGSGSGSSDLLPIPNRL